MNDPQHTCDAAAPGKLLSGELSEAEQRTLEAHLEQCPECQRRLEEQAAGADWWRELPVYLAETADATRGEEDCPVDVLGTLAAILIPSEFDGSIGRLKSYEIQGLVGRGGFGVVLKAFEPALNRVVAIKVLAPELAASNSARIRFEREAKAAAAVVHENVVPIHAVDECRGLPFLVMPYLRGGSLERRIRQVGPLPLETILQIGRQIAAGLSAAHAQGLVHRDIKPANVLLDEGVERVRITDFGLARAVDDASTTRSGLIVGTPQYMSPEQAAGEPIDPRSDLFSLGSVLYAMATGRPPFRSETTLGTLRMIRETEPEPVRHTNPNLPVWLDGLIARLLAKNPAERYPDAAGVATLLEACLAHCRQPRLSPLPAGLMPPRRSWSRRWLLGLLLAGLSLPFLAPGCLAPPRLAETNPSSPTTPASAGPESVLPSDEDIEKALKQLREDVDQLDQKVKRP
jgi:serine/threonine-protein kinase